jgi:hypothetical protein
VSALLCWHGPGTWVFNRYLLERRGRKGGRDRYTWTGVYQRRNEWTILEGDPYLRRFCHGSERSLEFIFSP